MTFMPALPSSAARIPPAAPAPTMTTSVFSVAMAPTPACLRPAPLRTAVLGRCCSAISRPGAGPARGRGRVLPADGGILRSLHVDLVQPPAQLLRGVDGVLVRAGDAVHPVEGAGHPAELAHRPQYLAVEIDLDDLADAADIHHLARASRHAERPGRSADPPFLLEVAVGVEGLNAAVGAVGHVERVVAVDGDAVGRVELAGRGAALAPLLEQNS